MCIRDRLMDLGATDEQLDCPMLFCCGRDGTASLDPVSYTHLDVYKRQILYRILGRFASPDFKKVQKTKSIPAETGRFLPGCGRLL